MSTMMRIRDHNGKWRRCGAECYAAKRPGAKCTCICGRANHGAGESVAIANTLALVGDAKVVYEKPPKRERFGQLTLPMAEVEEIIQEKRMPGL